MAKPPSTSEGEFLIKVKGLPSCHWDGEREVRVDVRSSRLLRRRSLSEKPFESCFGWAALQARLGFELARVSVIAQGDNGLAVNRPHDSPADRSFHHVLAAQGDGVRHRLPIPPTPAVSTLSAVPGGVLRRQFPFAILAVRHGWLPRLCVATALVIPAPHVVRSAELPPDEFALVVLLVAPSGRLSSAAAGQRPPTSRRQRGTPSRRSGRS